ncbi:uncharacterized protein LOC122306323 [Carya illinoinensis]|uniref:uncharacterized protein LOC122306323 n=1 Tax=Carya illinoinensis TaxID=32201 RepID=UPI001C7248E1|nr:uncharacterized protein LOC122306323 [Carya illinoinensis]
MIFSTNVNSQLQQEIMASWGIQQAHKYDKYLGLPSVVGRSKKRAFASIKSKVWKKLQGWKERLLSQGGKEVLIKAVALSIPSYSMSCFKLLESLCKELENMMAKFWWGQRREENKIRWRVGDGESINIWTDVWLPGQNQIPLDQGQDCKSSCQQVVQLIDGETGWWDAEIVRRTLPPREAFEVLRMPLRTIGQKGAAKTIRHFEVSGSSYGQCQYHTGLESSHGEHASMDCPLCKT